MFAIHKKIVVDIKGNPKEVILPWLEFKKMEELLGLDLDKAATNDLKQAKKDRKNKNKGAYVDLNSI